MVWASLHNLVTAILSVVEAEDSHVICHTAFITVFAPAFYYL